MRDQDLKKYFDDYKEPLDADRKSTALAGIAKAAESKRIDRHISFVTVLRGQLKFISKTYWAAEVVFILAAVLIVQGMQRGGMHEMTMLSVFSSIAALGSVCGMSEISKVFSCRMEELEQTCYFSLKQLMSVRLLIFGGLNLVFMTVFVGNVSTAVQYSFYAICIYMLVPFIVSNIFYFLAFTFIRGFEGGYMQIGAALLTGTAAFLPGMFPAVYEAVYLKVWAGILAAALIIFAVEIYYIFYNIKRGQMVCRN